MSLFLYTGSLYKTVHYKTVSDIRQFKGGPKMSCIQQKGIDYIEKMTIYDQYSVFSNHS